MTKGIGMLVDKILGSYDERYFGGGHKQTTYSEMFDISEQEGDYIGHVALNQESCWSKKKNVAITPHLSTLDGVVLAVLIVEKYLEKYEPQTSLSALFIDAFEIKAGATPIEDLNHIPVKLIKIEKNNANYSAKINILGMKINLSLTQYETTWIYVNKSDTYSTLIHYCCSKATGVKYPIDP